MKVLVLSDGMGQLDARGIEIISEILNKLSRHGIKIILVTTLDHFRDLKLFNEWKKQQEKSGLEIEVIDLSWLTKNNRYLALWLSKLLTSIKAIQIVVSQKPNIVHEYSSSPFLFLRTFLVSLFGNAKKVHTIITYNNKFLSQSFWAIFGNLLNKIVVPSQGFAQSYSRFLDASKIEVMSQGVDINRFASAKANRKLFNISPGKKTILFLGPPEKGKGLFLLLESAPEILAKNSNSYFLFVFHRKLYEREYERALEKIKETFSDHKKAFKVIQSLVDVPTLLKSVDIVALPQTIHHGTLIYPQTLLEAMAARKIVVVSDTKEIREIIKDGKNGYLFENNNPKELVKAIIKAQNAPISISVQAQKEVEEHHNLENTAKNIQEIYTQLS